MQALANSISWNSDSIPMFEKKNGYASLIRIEVPECNESHFYADETLFSSTPEKKKSLATFFLSITMKKSFCDEKKNAWKKVSHFVYVFSHAGKWDDVGMTMIKSIFALH